MASQYPPFIFQDAIPAQQMMAHAQAVNEGMRIAELGKARQAEGMFRMAQLQQQQRAQQEKNELDRMVAMSQIEQNRIANEFKEKELNQRATLTREGYQRDRDIYGGTAGLNPSLRTEMAKEEYNDRLAKEAKADELRTVTESEKALEDIDRLERQYRAVIASGSKNINLPVLQNKIGELTVRKKEILDGMKRKGYDYDFANRRFIGVERPRASQPLLPPASSEPPPLSAINTPATQVPVPSAFSLAPSGEARLSPFDMQMRGLQPGAAIQQGGNTFTVTPSFQANNLPPSSAAMAGTGDDTLDEMNRRYPGVSFVRNGNSIEPGGFEWDAEMKRIAEDPNIPAIRKGAMITDYIKRKYPGLFPDYRDAFEKYVPAIGRSVGGMLQGLLPGTLGR